jgi:hypothetical protein
MCKYVWHACSTLTHSVPGRVRQECELPYPLQKEEGEGEDGWALRDPATGATVLRLRFALPL